MKLFVPGLPRGDALPFLIERKSRLLLDHYHQTNESFIYRLHCLINNEIILEEVGQRSTYNNEIIWAIFECKKYFLILTPSQGVGSSESLKVEKHKSCTVEYFQI